MRIAFSSSGQVMGPYRGATNKLKEIEYNLLTVAETHL
jgi:hypothetical protein